MIKTTLVSQSNNLPMYISNNYIGVELEVLVYAKDEINNNMVEKVKNAARFKGLFTETEATQFDQYLKQARSEWDRDI